jgi:hypothetical protein
MWRLDRLTMNIGWHEWALKNGWVAHTWRRMLWQRKSA